MKIPPYHQLEWAGYVTSHCRAAVLGAALEDLSAVIAFETDALFTTKHLGALNISDYLGDFEATYFESLTYIQSGHYYGVLAPGTFNTEKTNGDVAKYRGVDRGFLSRANVERSMTAPPPDNYHPATVTRFFTAGVALARKRGMELWCTWRQETKRLDLQPSGKRRHGPCWCEIDGPAGTVPLVPGRWHLTHCPVARAVSCEYPVAWINPNPEMQQLTDSREAEVDWEA